MEADVLRLILLALGAVLVVGIYLWDRYKRSRTRLKGLSARKPRKQPVFAGNESSAAFSAEPEQQDLPHLNIAEAEDEVDVEPMPLTPQREVKSKVDDIPAETEDFSALNDQDYLHLSPALEDELPRMVIQIGLVNREVEYTGEAIREAMREVDLHYGEMGIYHRYKKNTAARVLFSVANMVEPGSFPKKLQDGFSTPGLLLFTQLPGAEDGLVIYSDMLYTAERLMALLGGTLQDETHSALSKQQVEHTRDLILEHRRKVQLARMK